MYHSAERRTLNASDFARLAPGMLAWAQTASQRRAVRTHLPAVKPSPKPNRRHDPPFTSPVQLITHTGYTWESVSVCV